MVEKVFPSRGEKFLGKEWVKKLREEFGRVKQTVGHIR